MTSSPVVFIGKLRKTNVFTIKRPNHEKLSNKLSKTRGFPQAEANTLVLAKEMNGMTVVDDEVARDVADLFDIKHKDALFILFRPLKKRDSKQRRGKGNHWPDHPTRMVLFHRYLFRNHKKAKLTPITLSESINHFPIFTTNLLTFPLNFLS